MLTDEQLMERYIAGDRAAFRELFRRYGPLVTRLVQRGLRSDEAHDLVQQTFLQLHRARLDFRRDGQLRPWLCAIALNVRRQYLRDSFRHRDLDRELALARPPGEPPVSNDVIERVQAAIALLPADQREVILLHWMEGLPFQEVAEIVGASLAAVRVRAHRGYQVLRRMLTAGENGAS
jgi:RNA polymerase sigma-70 factor (ECF subfamily)